MSKRPIDDGAHVSVAKRLTSLPKLPADVLGRHFRALRRRDTPRIDIDVHRDGTCVGQAVPCGESKSPKMLHKLIEILYFINSPDFFALSPMDAPNSSSPHASFVQKQTFVCVCGSVFAGFKDRAVCQQCQTRLVAQKPGQRGGNKLLYGLFCCNACGHHGAEAGASEAGPHPSCQTCNSLDVTLCMISPKNMVHPWSYSENTCKELAKGRCRVLRMAEQKEEAEKTYKDVRAEDVLRMMAMKSIASPYSWFTVYEHEGLLSYLAERLYCSVQQALKLVEEAVELEKKRQETRQFEKEKNLLSCSFCGGKKPKEQVFATSCVYNGEEDHPAMWCGACRKKENNFFKHQKEGVHFSKTCYECAHVRHYGCLECKGIGESNYDLVDLGKTFEAGWDTKVYKSHTGVQEDPTYRPVLGSLPNYKCAFCRNQTDPDFPLKKRCAKCKKPHLCCGKCTSVASCV